MLKYISLQILYPSNFITAAAAAKSLQSCPTLRPHRRQPTRPRHPWGSPGKNTGVGCHFLLQCMKVKVKSLSRPTLSDPMDCSLPGSSVHGVFQARVLEWGAILSLGRYKSNKNKTGSWLAQIMNSSLPNSNLNWRKQGKSLDHLVWPKSNPLRLSSGSDK